MSKDDHVSDAGPVRSEYGRGESRAYRDAGHGHISGGGKSSVYNGRDARVQALLRANRARPAKMAPPGHPVDVEPASAAHAARYHIGYGVNFTHESAPYPNQAHHMIPVSAFRGPPFTDAVMAVLRRAEGYDINEGANMVFLPKRERWAACHGLPTHNGDHPKYTETVKRDLDGLAKRIKALLDQAQHANCDPPSDVPERLRRLQDKYWRYLTQHAGTVAINTILDMTEPVGGPTR